MWRLTGSMSLPSEFSPTALLETGEVLKTWSPPALFDPLAESWRPTGDFVQSPRGWPGHSDHSLIVVEDGRAVAMGVDRDDLPDPTMVEIYDPAAEAWSLGANADVTRSQAEVVLLPTGHILVAGGQLERGQGVPTDAMGRVFLTDLYDPAGDRWRRAADLNVARGPHAVTLLVPDGRVVTTWGTEGSGNGTSIEAFEPPYLFRGVRPRIDAVSGTILRNGEAVQLTVSLTSAVTRVVLIGTNAVTHWVDGGVPRILSLPFSQDGDEVTAQVPSDPVVGLAGHYILFALVDGIPSAGVVVQILPSQPTALEDVPPIGLRARVSPNPVRSSAVLSWFQTVPGLVSLSIYDVRGRLIERRDLGHQPAGWRRLTWDATMSGMSRVANGVYWARLSTGASPTVARLVVSR